MTHTRADRVLERIKYGAYFASMLVVGIGTAWIWQKGEVGIAFAAFVHLGWQAWL